MPEDVMRLLIVSQYFYPETFRINGLAHALKQAGHEVVVLTAQPNYPSGKFYSGYSFFSPMRDSYEGIEVIRVPIFPRGRGRGWELILNYLSFVFFAVLFGLPRLKGRFDVTIAFCSSPITIAIPAIVKRWISGTPVAVWIQDLWPETFQAVTKTKNSFVLGLLNGLVSWIYRNVDQLWIQSQAYEESVLRHAGRKEQIFYVPNWAEDLYDKESWGAVVADTIPKNSFVFAGNMGRAQGLEALVEAAALVSKSNQSEKKAHFVFVGEGTLKSWLQEQVASRGLDTHVTFLPRRSPEEMPKILKAADALLITLGADSVYGQTVPSKVQSCLASGRPVIASLSGEGARLLKESEAALVVGPEDPRAIADAIQEFLAFPDEKRERMGASGHAFFKKHFTQTRIISAIESQLKKMSRSSSRS